MSAASLDAHDSRLPTRCPPWCASGPEGHRQALDEGCSVESARLHTSEDLATSLHDLRVHTTQRQVRQGGGHWTVQLVQDEEGGYLGIPIVQLELVEYRPRSGGSADFPRVELQLTAAEARSLAAQLQHLADSGELHP